jgi:alkanesulfonate monooxygenase SsuD/methylene tetrahydromethanopterin reductase-like flavin-dependent oxidoreductase (luciferase family)
MLSRSAVNARGPNDPRSIFYVMQVGASVFFQNLGGIDDGEFTRREIELGVLAEELGFDFLTFPEHHFDTYSMAPDNYVLLSAVAARTSRIKLGPAVAVLPWNDPLRVAEKTILLDHISDGRAILGLGRGLAKLEYDAFGIAMEEARGRFDEAAELVLEMLDTGIAEYDGEFYKQSRVELRPQPGAGFRDRSWCVSMSPGSARSVAKLGTPLLSFITGPIEQLMPMVEAHREEWAKHRGTEPPGPIFSDLTYCHPAGVEIPDEVRASWLLQFAKQNDHYGFSEVKFGEIKGYESYGQIAEFWSSMNIEDMANASWEAQANGTPEEIVAAWRHRLEVIGSDAGALFVFGWGALSTEVVERSMRLFAAEALPQLKELVPVRA